MRYASLLGSDIAFFLNDCSFGLGTERGDRIKPLKIKKKLWHVLVVPRVKVYSGQVYGAHKLQLTKGNDSANILIRHLNNYNILSVSNLLNNDLEPSVIRICPKLLALKKKLKSLTKTIKIIYIKTNS